MALITIQRNASLNQNESQFDQKEQSFSSEDTTDANDSIKSVSECYFAVRGAAIILPHEECIHVCKSVSKNSSANDIQKHLQSMFCLLRPEDTLKMAVKLESIYPNRTRYLIIVNHISQTNEQSCLLGIDYNSEATIGLVLPVWADTRITLDGDGGFSITSYERHHIFKPVSVQAMWSALQTLHKVSAKARNCNYFEGGGSHSWIQYYEQKITIERSSYNEWHAVDGVPTSPDIGMKPPEQMATEQLIRAKLKEVMMYENLDEVTSKYIRTKIEKDLGKDLNSYKSFIDEEMLKILGQMDESSQIFDYLYLGSEWNASNFEELKGKGVGKILNVTREIDNFFPGMFDYYNIRVYDDDSTELLKYWDKTFKYIRKARDEGSKVLVHCKKGISRSASVVLAFVMKETGWKLEEAFEFVKNKRNCIRPNSGFLKQLEIYEGILDASKQRHNSLWRSKSETNLVSKDVRLKRKNNKDFENSINRLKQMNDKNESNKENSNLDNLLTVPGVVERPKSWSPEDSDFEMMSSEKNSNCRPIKNKRMNGRQRFGTDPSCYNIVEAMKRIDQNLIQNTDSSRMSAKSKSSTVKTRVTSFESHSQPVGDVLRFSSGKVYSLANQFESNNCVKRNKQKEVIIDLSNIEDTLQSSLVHSKPPIPKQQVIDKNVSRDEPQEICDILGKKSSDSSQYLANCLKLKSDKNSFDFCNYYTKESSELQPMADPNSAFKASIIDCRPKSEAYNLKRTNSYDSILNELSLSLFDSQSDRRSHEEAKGHKRSSSLYSEPKPSSTSFALPGRWSDRPSSFSIDRKNRSKGFDKTNRYQSKSMPSVIEAVNEVLTSTRVIIDSIPDSSKNKSRFDAPMDYDPIGTRNQSNIRNDSKVLSVVRKSDGVVKRLTQKIEAKVKGSKNSDTDDSREHSQSTPSSPNFARNERPRSSTLNELSETKGKSFRKTFNEFPFKRIKCHSTCETENHTNKWSLTSKKNLKTDITHQSAAQTKIMVFESRQKSEPALVRAQPKKQQQGRSHPLTRLMPHTSLKP